MKHTLTNYKILVSAGPTYEPIDAVRFIGNRSSGKMGYAVAESLASLGAEVVLVSGPTHLTPQHQNITLHKVETAAQMYTACINHFKTCNGAIMVAAVADYTVANPASIKIKKKTDTLTLELVKTKDILANLGKLKTEKQILAGFALETNNELEHAKGKLKRKNLDFIVLNSLQDKGAGFGHNTNKITIIDKHNNIEKFELKTKAEVAEDIVNYFTTIICE